MESIIAIITVPGPLGAPPTMSAWLKEDNDWIPADANEEDFGDTSDSDFDKDFKRRKGRPRGSKARVPSIKLKPRAEQGLANKKRASAYKIRAREKSSNMCMTLSCAVT